MVFQTGSSPPTEPAPLLENRCGGADRIRLRWILLIVLIGVGLAVPSLLSRIFDAARQGRQKTWFVLRDQTAQVLNMVLSHAGAEYEISSERASMLNRQSPWGPVDLVAWGSDTSTTEASDALPPSVTVHRCGDYVFTYHGVDLNQTSPELWLVIQCLDPNSNDACWPLGTVFVGYADGIVKDFPVEDLSSQIELQNNVRARIGLAQLPDPRTVVGP